MEGSMFFTARHHRKSVYGSFVLTAAIVLVPPAAASSAQSASAGTTNGAAVIAPVSPPPDYVIGPDDLLAIVFWKEPDMSGQVRVRPDGKISLPLLRDVPAQGLTPDELRGQIETEAKRFVVDARASVMVHEINSRRVFVTGLVDRPGAFPLNGPMTVLQAIALAGGLLDFADAEHIEIFRAAGGTTTRIRFNYKDLIKGKKAGENVALKPGDTVVVP
jgi:polysaccharide export outer membrane protein